MKLRKRAAVMAAVAAGALVVAGVLSSVAGAGGNGGVYVVTPKSWGWCPTSSVYGVYFQDITSQSSGGDTGDDIVWVPVYLNQNNTISVEVECSTGVFSQPTTVDITPTRNGQSWFIGPGGGTWGN